MPQPEGIVIVKVKVGTDIVSAQVLRLTFCNVKIRSVSDILCHSGSDSRYLDKASVGFCEDRFHAAGAAEQDVGSTPVDARQDARRDERCAHRDRLTLPVRHLRRERCEEHGCLDEQSHEAFHRAGVIARQGCRDRLCCLG